jgi:peptidoglycan/LPS O-acetylase OafA/YrhL
MGLTALAMSYVPTAPLAVQIVVDVSFVTACVCGCLFVLTFCLRFGAIHSPILNNLAENAFGIYLFHYPFVVWLQYALLPFAWPAIIKGTIVFAGATALAWAMAVAARLVPFGPLLVGAERRLLATSPAPKGQYTSAQPRIVGR